MLDGSEPKSIVSFIEGEGLEVYLGATMNVLKSSVIHWLHFVKVQLTLAERRACAISVFRYKRMARYELCYKMNCKTKFAGMSPEGRQ
jgi:hypothetical protein